MALQVTLKELEKHVVRCVTKKLVPMISGSPGLGKSDLVRQIAKQFNLKVIDMRLAQCDPTDLNGFPKVEDGKAFYAPMNTFPLEGDPLPKGYDGWLLFLDEITSAVRATQAAAYKIVLDQMVGNQKLHERCVIVAAGNLATDKAIVNTMGTALQSRMVHFEVRVDHDSWIDWANTNHIDKRITAYLNFRPEQLHRFDPNHDDKTFACPRTWEFLSRLTVGEAELTLDDLPLYAGTVGEAAAHEFVTYTNCFKHLPTIEQIIRAPDTTAVPDEPGTLFALSGLVTEKAKDTNIVPIIEYIKRLPAEFQVTTMKAIGKRNAQLIINSQEFQDWCNECARKYAAA